MKELKRILSVDYGKKRTGLAWTDIFQISITPLATCDTSDFERILHEKLQTKEVGELVFGLPTHMDETLTSVGKKVTIIAKEIEKRYPDIKVILIDEAFTSVDAQRILALSGVKKKKRQEKGTVDQMSAVLILKDYLSSKS